MYTYYLGGVYTYYSGGGGGIFTIHGVRGVYTKQEGERGVHNIQGSCISTVQRIILYYTGGGATGDLYLLYLRVVLYYTGRGFLYNIQVEGYIFAIYGGGYI